MHRASHLTGSDLLQKANSCECRWKCNPGGFSRPTNQWERRDAVSRCGPSTLVPVAESGSKPMAGLGWSCAHLYGIV